ncbi:MAG: CpsD/CapB family tyrosine-protein kinase [Anaerolineae bacterium]|nr:CpsD/CapB family tyrosine-protein kinase [Anaerolineae bacterium]
MPLDLITITEPRSPAAEAYRSLRTNLEFSSLDHPLRTLLVTSPGPDEGKSTTLANLAVTTAQTGRRVIVVDCDLRRPHQHEIFGVTNGEGVTTMVRDEGALARPPLQETEVQGLWVLPSGPTPPNPAELLASQRMTQVIERLAEQADLVLFDAPPVVAVTDAAVLASKLDGVLLVINAGSTKRELAQRAKEILDRVNARLIGAVLNNVVLDSALHSYYGE